MLPRSHASFASSDQWPVVKILPVSCVSSATIRRFCFIISSMLGKDSYIVQPLQSHEHVFSAFSNRYQQMRSVRSCLVLGHVVTLSHTFSDGIRQILWENDIHKKRSTVKGIFFQQASDHFTNVRDG